VDEDVGDGSALLQLERTIPVKALARSDHGRVHLHIEGEDALRALLRPRRDSIFVRMCRRDEQRTSKLVPLERR
jgi:hypothetical protein